MPRVSKTAADRQHLRLAKVLVGLVWLAIMALCLVHKDSFTLEGILTYTPDKPLLAALVLVALFAVKSLSVFLYSGFLYMAAGVAAALHDLRCDSDFFFVLLIRLLNVFSLDMVSAYMGAVGVKYRAYLPASLLGLASMCVLFPIMGGSLADVRSPQFLLSAGVQLAIMLVSCAVFYLHQKGKNRISGEE